MHHAFLLLLVLHVTFATAEWYSSLGHMEDLVHEEAKLINSLQDYIFAEEAKLKRMKQHAKELQTRSLSSQSNLAGYLGHPVNQYHLMRRLVSEWDTVEDMIRQDVSQEFISNLTVRREFFPGEEDIKGTAQAIMRLQDTYHLDTHELAKGIVKGSKAINKMSLDDVYDIGRTAYLEGDHYHCALWMREAQARKNNGDTGATMFDILDHLAYCLAQQKNIQTALELTHEMLQMDPDHERIRSNHNHYKKILSAKKKGDDGSVVMEDMGDKLARPESSLNRYPELTLYERLCRDGSDPIPPKKEKKMKCFFWTNNKHPLLIIQPIKTEELWISPDVYRFYDLVSDSEIETLKSLAKPKLDRATVQNPITGKLEYAEYRVSKSAWLRDRESSTVKRISVRIDAVTGLSMETAEEFQIANYGVGGQYEPHYDYARETDGGRFDEELGNRIATVLFYFTNVEHGGATAFLQAKQAIRPIKGSAVFWYNLYPSGDGDERTRHAACPVLIGVKWVGNKWIHERGQEFRRKCGLTRKADNKIYG